MAGGCWTFDAYSPLVEDLTFNLFTVPATCSFTRAPPLAASVQSDRRRNFVVSNKGVLSRSDLIVFVLVLVLVLEDQNFIEDEGRGRRRGRLEHL